MVRIRDVAFWEAGDKGVEMWIRGAIAVWRRDEKLKRAGLVVKAAF